MTPDQTKEALKEAIKEWLDEQAQRVGWWTIRGVVTAGLLALLYFIMTFNGWKIPN